MESLAARGVGLYPALGLPLLAAQHQKPASVSSASPRSSPANSAPSSPTQKVIIYQHYIQHIPTMILLWSAERRCTRYAFLEFSLYMIYKINAQHILDDIRRCDAQMHFLLVFFIIAL